MFTEAFPEVPVFIQFGNNDCKFHDSAPSQDEKDEYYNFIFELWFKNHPANVPFAEAVEHTFKYGGYYEIEVTPSFSLVALNTMYYNKD